MEEVSLDVWLLKTTFIVQRLFIGPEKSVFRQKWNTGGKKRHCWGILVRRAKCALHQQISVELIPYLGVWIWSTRQSLVFALVLLSYQKDY